MLFPEPVERRTSQCLLRRRYVLGACVNLIFFPKRVQKKDTHSNAHTQTAPVFTLRKLLHNLRKFLPSAITERSEANRGSAGHSAIWVQKVARLVRKGNIFRKFIYSTHLKSTNRKLYIFLLSLNQQNYVGGEKKMCVYLLAFM